MKKTLLFSCLVAGAMFTACDSGSNQGAENTADTTATTNTTGQAGTTGSIGLEKAENSPEFPDAMLEQTQPENGAKLPSGPVTFQYNIKNYELTKMTESEHANMLANSEKGQHIHLIVDNEPYDALYETTYQKELSDGHHVELSFLSRSYHESIKTPEAYVLRQFTVGNAPQSEQIDLNAPHMFYSRPKGDYTGKDTERIMLDFYLVNTELSENGKKVRATINGQEFMITDWKPYHITGLPMGETTIKLELLDENGNLVQSPYNPVTRTINLKSGNEQAMAH
ncbi:phosphopeptide-binding protein [Cesiribacter sp. SM1]|uniref:phosphopeptide-binding protein n=1 Tax=Cesiribacter sp. SM1 TaxID=2861196 RepID=UPI001CD72B2C|nr:phosphopeptide-binding protein [Cesiribacter sp. SM1]